MSFANPFAQFSNQNTQQSDDIVTTNYLTGLPDVRLIENEHAAIIFKQLLKRHNRTKFRALNDLNEYIQANEISDTIHLAFIQLYSKLSLDVSSEVRAESHKVLKSLYLKLGKASAKYLKYSVGPLVSATYEVDVLVSNAAKDTLNSIFPPEKQPLLFEKMQSSLISYIYDGCMNATPLTLSDERSVTEEEATQKYGRLVNGCLSILINHASFFNLDLPEIHELVETGRIFKFFETPDSNISRASLKLAQTHITELEPFTDVIWQALLRAARTYKSKLQSTALDIIHLMNIYSKRYLNAIWTDKNRSDSISSIAQFVNSDPVHPSRFWPLLYNLLLMVPTPPEFDMTPIYKPLEKTVLRVRHNSELEESIWGCFVSLSAKMGDQYVLKVFRVVAQNADQGISPVAVSKFLERVAEIKGVHELVKQQLPKSSIQYVEILARTHKFTSEINEYLENSDIDVSSYTTLLRVDGNLTMPSKLKDSTDAQAEWINVAIYSESANAGEIVERVGSESPLLVLQNAKNLSKKHVPVNFDEFVLENFDTQPDVCKAAVEAFGTLMVTNDIALMALHHLVQLTLSGKLQLKDTLRFLKQNGDAVKTLAANSDPLHSDLESLALEDNMGVVSGLLDLKISENNKESQKSNLAELDLAKIELHVPEEAKTNVLCAPIPPIGNLSNAISLLESLPASLNVQEIQQNAVKIAILKAYFDSWVLGAKKSEVDILKSWMENVKLPSIASELWELLESPNYGVAYHAAMAFIQILVPDDDEIFTTYERKNFSKSNLKGAVQAYLSLCEDSPHYTAMQSTFMRESIAKRMPTNEYMYVDRSFIPESTSLEVDVNDPNAVYRIRTFGGHVENLSELAFDDGVDKIVSFAAVCALETCPHIELILDHCITNDESNGMDQLFFYKCLALINSCDGDELELNEDIIEQLLILLQSCESDFPEKPWIALQILRKFTLIDTKFKPDISFDDDLTHSAKLVLWLIVFEFLPKHELPEDVLKELFAFIEKNVKQLSTVKVNDPFQFIQLPDAPPLTYDGVSGYLLVKLSLLYPNFVREWYRNQRQLSFIKQLDSIFAKIVAPNLMRELRFAFNEAEFEVNVNVTINEKLREIRVERELEDDISAEIIFTLPDQYPAKPAIIEFKNLASINEAKKRHWLLEARQTMQNSGCLAAVTTLLTRLNNFLDGVEPCAICYMLLSESNKLPNKPCSQCHNLYHTDCLFQWFSNNTERLCPMCRNPM